MGTLFENVKKMDDRTGQARRRRLASAAAQMTLPKPQRVSLPLLFDPEHGIVELDHRAVMADRAEDSSNGYQRAYEDSRARVYGQNFNWGLFGTPLLNLRDDGKYWVISGQHRIPAAGYAGHSAIECGVYEGLTREQEAWLFNQEATQRKDLTALGKFWSGYRAGDPLKVGVMDIVTRVGGTIMQKSSPRTSNITGIAAVAAMETSYDQGGPQLLEDSLVMLRDGLGDLNGKTADGFNIIAMTQFLGTFTKGSPYGVVDRKKLLTKLQASTPEEVRKLAGKKDALGSRARFLALVELYNRKTFEQNRLDDITPSWRKAVPRYCTAPGCKPLPTYRRGLCRQHYISALSAERVSAVTTGGSGMAIRDRVMTPA